MRRHHDDVLRAGGTCVMVSVNCVGFSAVEDLRRICAAADPRASQRLGALSRHPALGIDFAAYQKLWRLAGVDQLHVNGLRSKFWEPDDSVIASARACLAPFAGARPMMPVFSSGQWAGQAPDMYAASSTTDLMHLAGGGIIGHPEGVAAGVPACGRRGRRRSRASRSRTTPPSTRRCSAPLVDRLRAASGDPHRTP